MLALTQTLNELREQLTLNDPEAIARLAKSSWLIRHELALALYALNCDLIGQSGQPIIFSEKKSDFPSPFENVELGLTLNRLGELRCDERLKQMALARAKWQLLTIDHNLKPLLALFSREEQVNAEKLQMLNCELFYQLSNLENRAGLQVDPDFGIMKFTTSETTQLGVAAGCKSGMGAFLHRDVGIVNFGPAMLPVGELDRFGIAGQPKNLRMHEAYDGFTLSFENRVAYPSYSGLWIQTELKAEPSQFKISNRFEGFQIFEKGAFLFYAKAPVAIVAGSHKLKPGSLDRYSGPPQSIKFRGAEGSVVLEALEGVASMEVIPLGAESFWEARFLVAFSLADKFQRFSCHCQ